MEKLKCLINYFRKRIDGRWGSFNEETGKWSGMLSNLVNGEADLVSANLAICCGRTEVIDYAWTLSAAISGFGIKSKMLHYIYKTRYDISLSEFEILLHSPEATALKPPHLETGCFQMGQFQMESQKSVSETD